MSDSDESLLSALVTSLYQFVIVACVVSMGLLYYLMRTRIPLKEKVEEEATGSSSVDQGFMSESNDDLLAAVVDGIHLSSEHAEDEDDEEAEEEEEEEESEMQDAPKSHKKRQVIREVTVRKLILPADAEFSDVQKLAAKNLIGRAIEKRKQVPADLQG